LRLYLPGWKSYYFPLWNCKDISASTPPPFLSEFCRPGIETLISTYSKKRSEERRRKKKGTRKRKRRRRNCWTINMAFTIY
jgi:hypothetical protein